MDEHGIICRKIRDGPNIFHAIVVPNALQPYIFFIGNHNALGHNGPTRLYHFIRRHYYWKKLHQYCNKYAYSCPECQQVSLKEPQYVKLHSPTLPFPMSFISMELLGSYHETEKGNQYALIVISMLTNYIFRIPIRLKSTEEIIKSYLTDLFSTFGGKNCILSDRGSKFTSKQFTY